VNCNPNFFEIEVAKNVIVFPILRIEFVPFNSSNWGRGELQLYWIAKNGIVFPIPNFFEIGN
jgi:hypothetical protein